MTVAGRAGDEGAALATAIPRESFLLAGALFLIVATTNIITPLLPDIRNDFGVSIAAAGVIVGSYGLARLVTDLPAGFIIDGIGHRRVSFIALVLLVAASIVGLNATTVELLIAARVASGVAVAILATVILSALGSTASPRNRGKVMSLFHVANNTGIAIYPLAGGFIGAAFGWRATFGVTIILVVAAGAILMPVLPRLRPQGGGGQRAATPGPRVLHGRPRVLAIAAANAGVVANMVNRHGFRNTVLPLYAATVLGLGGVSIATAIALMSITGLMVATPGGMLGDRIGRRRIISAGLAAIAVGDLVFLLTGDLVTFLAAAALIGFGDFFASSQTALLSEIVPPEQRTKVLSGYRFSSDLGAFVGPVLLAAVMDLVNAKAAIILAAAILLSASLVARLGIPRSVDA
ncbi:MAG: transporter, family, multidrug resistance protein [Chloroflexota bacterium]|nr:transporter, family, multidrug resistance protein [Chloroflexota bacterium]